MADKAAEGGQRFQVNLTGMGSYAFRWSVALSAGAFNVLSFIEKSHEIGARTVQICDNLPLDGLTAEETQQVGEWLGEYGLVAELGISGCRQEKLERYIEICQALDAQILRVVLTDRTFRPSLEEARGIFKSVRSLQQSAGVHIAIENHFHFTPEQLTELIGEIDSPLTGICLDPFNSILRFRGVRETIDLLSPYVLTAHVKDATITRQGTGFMVMGCPQGDGQLDLAYMLRAIGRNGHNPNLYVESWMERLEDPGETIRQEEAWSRHALATINKTIETIRSGAAGEPG